MKKGGKIYQWKWISVSSIATECSCIGYVPHLFILEFNFDILSVYNFFYTSIQLYIDMSLKVLIYFIHYGAYAENYTFTNLGHPWLMVSAKKSREIHVGIWSKKCNP